MYCRTQLLSSIWLLSCWPKTREPLLPQPELFQTSGSRYLEYMTHPPTFTNTWPQAPQPVDFNCCCLKPAMVDLWPELRLATCTRKPAAAGGGGQTRGGSPCREWCLPTKQTDWCTSGSHDQTLDWGLYAFEFVKKFQTERLASFQTQNETISAKTNIFGSK